MEIDEKVIKIMKKLKSQQPNKTEISTLIFNSIEEAINLISHARESMLAVEGKKLEDNSGVTITYGFTRSRLGEIKAHPGAAIIKEQWNIITQGFKLPGIEIEKEKPKPREKNSGPGEPTIRGLINNSMAIRKRQGP